MMISKTTPSELIGLSHIDVIPVWNEEEIVLFDLYTKDGKWLGSKRLFKYALEFDKECKQS